MRWLLFLFLLHGAAYAAENCASMGGVCKTACAASEYAEQGAFDDCSEVQDCCVPKTSGPGVVKCCIHSFDSRNSGKDNCSGPLKGVCAKGSGSPVECSQLSWCK